LTNGATKTLPLVSYSVWLKNVCTNPVSS
jgi:hypothetical protein